ncbi:PAAR domain-containing protein [Paraburkholderia sp. Se-20369]|nr:PAAR domain-containing protein [Paraburkholderia sp. Se-20369]
MKNAQGHDMVRPVEKADHGGEVVECADDLKRLGFGVVLDGHGSRYLRIDGVFPLLASGPRTHRGQLFGYRGDKTGCGATVLGPRTAMVE